MGRLVRILKHRWLDETDAARTLGKATLAELELRVAASERHHSGEIRICVEAGMPLAWLWRDATPRQRAVALFGELRVWDTEHNNGVLIYVLLAERAIEIIADRGLQAHVPQEHWARVVDAMRQAFAAGAYGDGLALAIDAVDGVLLRHFRLEPGQANPNELPDRPALR